MSRDTRGTEDIKYLPYITIREDGQRVFNSPPRQQVAFVVPEDMRAGHTQNEDVVSPLIEG